MIANNLIRYEKGGARAIVLRYIGRLRITTVVLNLAFELELPF